MSRSAHAQHPYKLRKLPRCLKCKIEFMLVAVRYDNINKLLYEWECPKCKRLVPKERLKEEEPNEWESFLHNECKQEYAREKNTKNCKRNN